MIYNLNFEQVIVVIGATFALLFLYDLSVFLRLLLAPINKSKKKRADQQKDIEEGIMNAYDALKEDDFLEKINGSKVKELPRFITRSIFFVFKRLLIDPFNLSLFADNLNNSSRKIFSFKVLWSLKVIAINIIGFTLLIVLVNKTFIKTYPQYKAIYPTEEATWNDYTRPVEIEFDVPIDVHSIEINRHPDTPGYWEYEKSFSFLPFVRRIKFYPTETIFPGEKVLFYMNEVSNHYHTYKGGEHLITYYSIELPEIVSSNPGNDAKDTDPSQDIVFTLNQKDGVYVNWAFKFDKKVDFKVIRNQTNEIRLQLNEPLKQGKNYTVTVSQTPLASNTETNEVIREGETSEVYTLTFTTVKAPFISSVSPEGTSVLTDEKIKIEFDQEMDQEAVNAAFSLEPEVEGEISWPDGKTFVFTPEGFEKETHYEVTFAKGLKSIAGGISEQKIEFEFDTVGAVKVAGWNPGYGAGGVSRGSNINVAFDQAVDHDSAESKFSISPNVSGSFSWSGKTLVFNPSSNLAYNTTYTVTIGSPVKTVHGYDSRQAFSSSFTVESSIVKLNVPFIAQTHAFTCNVVAAAMTLSFKGVSASEMSVYNGIPKDNTPCVKSGSTITEWGDPYVGYVGHIDGGGSCGGYGVYWQPIANYISGRGRSTKVFSGWNAVGLAQEIEKGNPVILWGQNGLAGAYDKSWQTPGGKNIYAINGMHSVVAIGYIGASNNPSHIIVKDGWRGEMTLTVSQLYGPTWGYFNRTAVVVY